MNILEALRLQVAWGADEALLEAPQDRRAAAMATAPPQTPRAKTAPAALPAGPADAARIAAGCASLDELQTAMAAFTGCALRDTATQLVFADGNPAARLLLVGEAPGAEEDRAGRPFVGPAGQLLDKMLASIGQDRGNTRIINVVPWRPPGNRTPTESEIALCLPFLHRQIALLRPACLVMLGAIAARALLPETKKTVSIGRLRGNWQEVEVPELDMKLPAMPMWHPAYLLRMPTAKRDAWHDLILLRERLISLGLAT
jgi:DNA polymerase